MTPEARRARILVVEDENIVALDIERGLRRLGYEVVAVSDNAEDAVRSFQAHAPDLVLMDIRIKGDIDGIEAAKLLQRERRVPVVFLTAFADQDTLERAKQAGPYGYLFKPFQETELHTAIEVALHKHRSDVREKDELGAALQRSEVELAHMMDAVVDYAILLVDRSGRLTTWNTGATRIFGYESSEIVGRSFACLIPSPDADEVVEAELEAAAKEGRFETEARRVRKDGSEFWASVVVSPIRDDAGTLTGFSKITRDISDRKSLIDELVAAVRVRDEFVSIASHELRTPLASLHLQLQIVGRRLRAAAPSADPELVDKVDLCERQSRKLATLLDELLDVTRIRLGRMSIARVDADLLEITREAVARELIATSHAPPVDIRGDSVRGCWDVQRIEQVVQNLVSNAFKYGDGSPVAVTVDVEPGSGHARITVHDDGPGVPPELRERIFERFERAVGPTHVSGLGLGLYICRQIVEAHQGRIRVDSDPGRGTTFTVTLPKEEP